MIAHLWASGADAPLEYMELVLCRDIYHCRPSQLREENMLIVQKHIVCAGAEAKVAKMRSNRR